MPKLYRLPATYVYYAKHGNDPRCDENTRGAYAEAIQVEAYSNDVPYVPTGQFVAPTAYRKNLDGIIVAPVVFLWNVEKK